MTTGSLHIPIFFSTLAILKLIHIGFSLENLVSIDPSTETLAEIVTISRTSLILGKRLALPLR